MRGQRYWQTILVTFSSPAFVALLEVVVVGDAEVVDGVVVNVVISVDVDLTFGASDLNLFSCLARTLTRCCMQRICRVQLGSFRHRSIRAISEMQVFIIDTARKLTQIRVKLNRTYIVVHT